MTKKTTDRVINDRKRMKTDQFCEKKQKNRAGWLKWKNGNGKINIIKQFSRGG
jgi:hypothetical protein